MISTALCGKKMSKFQRFAPIEVGFTSFDYFPADKKKTENKFAIFVLGRGNFFPSPLRGECFWPKYLPLLKKPSFHPERRGGWKNFTLSKNSFELDARSKKNPKLPCFYILIHILFPCFFVIFRRFECLIRKKKKNHQNFDDHRGRVSTIWIFFQRTNTGKKFARFSFFCFFWRGKNSPPPDPPFTHKPAQIHVSSRKTVLS